MPLEIRPLRPADSLSWVRLRAQAYYGPTHDVLHSGMVRESSMRSLAEDKKREIAKAKNNWYWKCVDTDLKPGQDDPPDNGGRTVAVAVWSMHNVKEQGSNESASVPAEKADESPGFLPPELRIDALNSLLDPMREVQNDIMGSKEPYFMLNSLATHPNQQRRGAGRMLLNWGLKKADEEGLITYLDCSDIGLPMYEKAGFKLVKATEWDRVPWGGQGKTWHGHMTRQPKRRLIN